MWGQSAVFLRFRMNSSLCMSPSTSVWIKWCDHRETRAARASLFQANSSPASGDFAVAGTSKWISPTSPQAIDGLFWVFFPTFPLLSLRSLVPPSIPSITGSLIKAVFNWFRPMKVHMLRSTLFHTSCHFQSTRRSVRGLTNTDTQTSDATSFPECQT